MHTFTLAQGSSPLLVSVPHAGTSLPGDLRARLAPHAQGLPDTDWYVDRLYGMAQALGATVLVARLSRYAVDLNRPDDDAELYPGQPGSGLIPEADFLGRPLWTTPVTAAERAQRVAAWWRPYHDTLDRELARLRHTHGHAVLWDAHSIKARVPRLFEGRLPDLNLGTYGGRSCAPSLQGALEDRLAAHPWSWVSNGRFQGGHITRSKGRPSGGVHAVQLEIAQEAYMQEQPPVWDDQVAEPMMDTVADLLSVARDWRPDA